MATNFVRLHINGGMVGEKPLSYSSTKDPDHEGVQKITLVGNDGGDQRMQGYVHFVRTYPMPTSISDHFPKVPTRKKGLHFKHDISCTWFHTSSYSVEVSTMSLK